MQSLTSLTKDAYMVQYHALKQKESEFGAEFVDREIP